MSNESAWEKLKSYTDARIALGRSGGSLPTSELLKFRKDHALAKDAVWTELDVNLLEREIEGLQLSTVKLASQATDRLSFIKRPDLGRKLDQASIKRIASTINI